jgi:hypothetical protein
LTIKIAAGTVFYRTEDILVPAMWNLIAQGIHDFYLIRHDQPDEQIDQLLQTFAGHARIRIVSKTTSPFLQGRMMSLLVAAAKADGFDAYIPFDSDEFLQNELGSATVQEQLAEWVSNSEEIALRIQFTDFVQHNSVENFSETDLLRAKYTGRASKTVAQPQPGQYRQLSLRLARPADFKVILNLRKLPSESDFFLTEGQHALYLQGQLNSGRLVTTLTIAHLPYRSRQNLFDRKLQANRRKVAGFGSNVSEHMQIHLEADNDLLEKQWNEISWIEGETGPEFADRNPAIEIVADDSLNRVYQRIADYRSSNEPVPVSKDWIQSEANSRFEQRILDAALDSEIGFPSRNSLVLQIRELSSERELLLETLKRHAPDAAAAHFNRAKRASNLVRLISKLAAKF